MTVVMSYFLMTLKKIDLEKFCLSNVRNLQTVSQHIDTRWQVFLLSKSECLKQPIQIQLSRNREIFSEFFSAFLKSS